MSTKDAYKQKIDAELIRHARQVDDLEQKADATRAKLKELDEAGEDTWELLKDGVENIWGALQSALNDTVSNFKD